MEQPGGLWGRASHLSGKKRTECGRRGGSRSSRECLRGWTPRRKSDCWSPGEAGGSVSVLYSLFEHFPVLSWKDPVSPVLKEVLSYVYLIQTSPHLLTPFLMLTESLRRMKCLSLPLGASPVSFLCDHREGLMDLTANPGG